MSPVKWNHVAVMGGGLVGLGVLVWYLMKEEKTETTTVKSEAKDSEKLDVRKATQAQVQLVLQKIIESQDKMKAVMKDLCSDLCKTSYTFDQVYQKVKAVQPDDPLEVSGLSMSEFDQLLEKFQYEPNIRDAIGKIMGAPGPSGFSGKLKELVKEFHALPDTESYDMKTVTIAAQAIVGTEVESKYKLNSEEIEAAVLLHHQSLSTVREQEQVLKLHYQDAEFARMNVQMQSTMSELMG